MSQRAQAALVSLGCRVNRAESEGLMRSLAGAGVPLGEPGQSPVIVVNTCCVTAEAQAKSRKALRHWSREPHVERVIAWGCAARLFASELEGASEKVVVAGPADDVAALVRAELDRLPGHETRGGAEEARPARPLLRARPSLKIQDGCDRRCGYCIVWKARGPARSLPAREVIRRVRDLGAEGNGEIVLCGINLGAWEEGGLALPQLLWRLLDETDVGRVRLSSIEPEDATDELLDVMAASEGRIAPYLALPLQSGCDATLARMGRRLDAEGYAERVARARERVEDVAVVADFMCGFPGETDEDWETSLSFARDLGLAKLHVFRFSPRPGTPAASMKGAVTQRVAKDRAREALELSLSLERTYAVRLIGKPQRILVEEEGVGSTGSLVRALVDPVFRRETLIELLPHGLVEGSVLDCRS